MDWHERVVTMRRELHQIPEVGFEENRTRAYVMKTLEGMGLSPHIIGQSGIMVDIEGKQRGKTLLLRADIDGLPLHEDTDLPFASQQVRVMHACGHDGHMAMLLATAGWALEHREFSGTLCACYFHLQRSDRLEAPK